MAKKYLFLLFPITIVIFFFKSLFVYFAQDDFFLLNISIVKNVQNFFLFFIPLKDVVWYRPLSSQVFFFLGYTLFRLHPFGYHVIVFITHMVTSFFLFMVTKEFLKNRITAYFASALYALSWVHVLSLSWLATYSFILGPLFLIVALLTYSQKKYLYTFLFFVFGILSIEVFIIFPVILLIYHTIFHQKFSFIRFLPYLLVVGILLYVRYILYPSSVSTESYRFLFTPKIFSTIKFYSERLIGLPMVMELMPLQLKLLVFGLAFLFVIIIIKGIFAFHTEKEKKNVFFFILLGCIGIIPFLPLTSHVSPHYLSFALIGFAPVLAYFLVKSLRYPIFGFIIFAILQIINIHWTYRTHWIFQRAHRAQQLVAKKSLIHPVGSEEYFSLGANSAEEVFDH